MQTQTEFCLCFTKINTKFYAIPILPLISSVGSSPNTKKLFLRLSVCDDELLSISKFLSFLAESLAKLLNFLNGMFG